MSEILDRGNRISKYISDLAFEIKGLNDEILHLLNSLQIAIIESSDNILMRIKAEHGILALLPSLNIIRGLSQLNLIK